MRGCHWNTLQYITVSLWGRRGARSLAPTHTLPLPLPASPPPLPTTPGCLSGRCQHVTMSADTNDGAERPRLIFHILDTQSNSSNSDSAAEPSAHRSIVSPLPKLRTHQTGRTHLSELQTDATPALWRLGGKALGERGSGEVRAQAGMRPFSGQ